MFQKISTHKIIPRDAKNSITIPIYKKENKNNPETYRMVSLLKSCSKLLTKTITTKITDKDGISDEHPGFRQNQSNLTSLSFCAWET